MKPAYRVMSACQSYAPARTFSCRQEALAYAHEAALRFHVPYAIHERRLTGRWRLVLTLDPVPLCGQGNPH
jgi:hypothetical protein